MAEPARSRDAHAAFDPLECLACGLCLEVCPTYGILRDEGSGPRGRIRLMDLLARDEPDRGDWIFYLEQCVGCLACQAHCPAGLPYGAMLDRAQARLADNAGGGFMTRRLRAWALDSLLHRPARLRRLWLLLATLRLLGLAALLTRLRLYRLPGLDWLEGLRYLPSRRPKGARPSGPRPGAPFLFFTGCVSGLLYPAEERAVLRILAALGGYELVAQSACCGAVHRHLGKLDEACELARRNIAAYEGKEGLIVTQVAGCGAALKEYGEWLAGDQSWAERARRFSERVRDLSEVLPPERLGGAPETASALAGSGGKAAGQSRRRVTYDDPCHAIHAQGISEDPRALLDAIPGLERVEMAHPERCCGAGGTYFLRQPELSREMIAGKLRELEATGAGLLLTSNTGCRLQWEAALAEAGMDVELRHPAELWAEALRD